ncbi:uncharacterized protein LOC135805815 [Sycon ciliatum]|uniref:uncharacterized protein LOC135805815 n=1 Tax=Sycon ciliatum TaxID=27933 RepID=UPI0020AB9C70|eukprot:scpid25544/ scgid21908/ 
MVLMVNLYHVAALLVATVLAWCEYVGLQRSCKSPPEWPSSRLAVTQLSRLSSSGRAHPNANNGSAKQGNNAVHVVGCANFSSFPPSHSRTTRFLTYQPPGNGWNNQRQAMELALAMALLLDRTLIVHPMSPHELGLSLKRPRPGQDGSLTSLSGYQAYNAIQAKDLTPISSLLDLQHISRTTGVSIVEWCDTQAALRKHMNALQWQEVCHSGGHGYWVDQMPRPGSKSIDSQNVHDLMYRQQFQPVGGWFSKCESEIVEQQRHLWDEPLVRSVMGLASSSADVIYFSEGTMFGIDLRFIDKDSAMAAQNALLDAIRLEESIRMKAREVAKRLSPFNAVHVRRGDHQLRKADASLWLETMQERGFLKATKNLYIATDEQSRAWFQPFSAAGYNVVFASDVEDILLAKSLPAASCQDITGVYEQAILMAAQQFAPSPHSTFSAFVLRSRNETEFWDGMLTAGTRIKWVGHTIRHV